MFRVQPIESWLQFEKLMHDRLIADARDWHYRSYFRGHADASWHLQTTLERSVSPRLSVSSYYAMIQRIRRDLETFTDARWDLPPRDEFLQKMSHVPSAVEGVPHEYMGYLRHFGFPSPFLDWTFSPFVAAFFAFRDVTSPADSVAIFEYLEVVDAPDEPLRDYPQILPVFAASRNNKRYFLQQSAHTVCLRMDGDEVFYEPHENPRSLAEDTEVITKYVLPATERAEVFQTLEAYNINAFSLVGTEESLLETLFLKRYLNASRARSYFGKTLDEDDVWSMG